MAIETVKIIDFAKALEFFESAFKHLDQKEVEAIDLKIIRLSVQRLSYTSAQINETCLVILAQIEALENHREAEGETRRQAEALIFQPPERRDTEKDLEELPSPELPGLKDIGKAYFQAFQAECTCAPGQISHNEACPKWLLPY